jgi:hypothetical protein
VHLFIASWLCPCITQTPTPVRAHIAICEFDHTAKMDELHAGMSCSAHADKQGAMCTDEQRSFNQSLLPSAVRLNGAGKYLARLVVILEGGCMPANIAVRGRGEVRLGRRCS